MGKGKGLLKSVSLRLIANCGFPGFFFKSIPSKLDFCLLSLCSFILDFGEQHIVPFLGHLKISVVCALPKHVNER